MRAGIRCGGVWRRESGCLGSWVEERACKSYNLEFNRRFGQAGFGDSGRHAIGVGVLGCDALGGNLVRIIGFFQFWSNFVRVVWLIMQLEF